MIDTVVAGALVAAVGSLASALLPIRGLHDWLVPGAKWRLLSPTAMLTFDDGPDPARTPRVLDLLAHFGTKATFFVIGERAAREPALVRRMATDGHQVGNHSWDHRSMPFLSRAEIRDQLMRTQQTIEAQVGARATLVRPPYGRRDYRFYREARQLGLTPMMWSLDSGDWLGLDVARVARRVSHARAGDIVLLHDGNSRARGLHGALSLILAMHGDRFGATANASSAVRVPSSAR